MGKNWFRIIWPSCYLPSAKSNRNRLLRNRDKGRNNWRKSPFSSTIITPRDQTPPRLIILPTNPGQSLRKPNSSRTRPFVNSSSIARNWIMWVTVKAIRICIKSRSQLGRKRKMMKIRKITTRKDLQHHHNLPHQVVSHIRIYMIFHSRFKCLTSPRDSTLPNLKLARNITLNLKNLIIASVSLLKTAQSSSTPIPRGKGYSPSIPTLPII